MKGRKKGRLQIMESITAYEGKISSLSFYPLEKMGHEQLTSLPDG